MNSGFLTRTEIEEKEQAQLATYACLSSESKGRKYNQAEHPLRTAFQRDRDRIIHSSAFRRLEYKTQVFIPHERDHYRTRLTHTIEVAQITRTIARNLRLNEDLAEAIALSHDLGHTPFGHSGEDVLSELLGAIGGFNHNLQSLRVIDILEERYADHPGLNLSFEVREGIIKHATGARIVSEEFDPHLNPTMEASLVDIVDEITYNSHDIDDGLSSGIINFKQIKESDFWNTLKSSSNVILNDKDQYARHNLARFLIDFVVTDLIKQTAKKLNELSISSLNDVRKSNERIYTQSDEVALCIKQLKSFLKRNLYKHSKMVSMTDWAKEIIEKLFGEISKDNSLMPERYRKMLNDEKQEIVVADYIAGMTDRFAIGMYDQFS